MPDTAVKPLPSLLTLEQEAARRHLLKFARYVHPPQGGAPSIRHSTYQTPPHIQKLAEHLEAVERGELRRLMVHEPPRTGKSTAVSQVFPCWYLGKHPEREIFQTGYADEIATFHSRKARDILSGQPFSDVFPGVHHAPGRAGQDQIQVARQAAHVWGTTSGGTYRAAGILGPIAGFGADLLLIDDPHKNREEANSVTIQEKIWDQYRGVLYPRLSPDAAIIVVMTRWSPDDLGGRLVQEMEKGGGDNWTILSMPAVNEDGEALWPERYPIEELRRIEIQVGPFEWSAQFQQEPTLRGGNRFNADRIQKHEDLSSFPETTYIRFWDLASSEKERSKSDPDYTVGALVGVTMGEIVPRVWVKDLVRCQAEAPERDEVIKATTERDGRAVRVAVESVAGYKDTATTLKKILKGLRTVIKVDVSKDKSVRAAPLEPVVEADNLHVLKADWNDALVAEFRGFPAGKHDDIVDAVSGGFAQAIKYAVAGAGQTFDMSWWDAKNRYNLKPPRWRNSSVSRHQFWSIKSGALDEEGDGEDNALTVKVSFEMSKTKRIAVSSVVVSDVSGVDVPEHIVAQAKRENVDGKLEAITILKSSASAAAHSAIVDRQDWVSEMAWTFDATTFGDRADRATRAAQSCKQGSVLIPHATDDTPWPEELERDLEYWPDVPSLEIVSTMAAGVIYLQPKLAEGWRQRSRPE